MPLPDVSGANRRTSQSAAPAAMPQTSEHEQEPPGGRHPVRDLEEAVPPAVGGLEGEPEARGDQAGEDSDQRGPGDDLAPPLLPAVEIADLAPDVAAG